MATLMKANWTDNVSVVATQVLALGAQVKGTLDLRTKVGAYLHVKIGRLGTTALAVGVDVRVNNLINAGTAVAGGPFIPVWGATSGLTAAVAVQCATSDSASGQKTLTTGTNTSFAAGDNILIIDVGKTTTTRCEFHRISKKATSTTFTLENDLLFTHTAAIADYVYNQADIFNGVWVQGGNLLEVIFHYGRETAAAESVVVSCLAQTYNYDEQASS